jgi:hypothetical protein
MLKLFYAPHTCALASHIALDDAGAEYSTVRINFAAKDQRKPEYLAIDPKGRVPALVTETGILTETPAILAFIAHSFPQARLADAKWARGPEAYPGDHDCMTPEVRAITRADKKRTCSPGQTLQPDSTCAQALAPDSPAAVPTAPIRFCIHMCSLNIVFYHQTPTKGSTTADTRATLS